ncbi:MAG: DUF4345 domain-containing protein [Deltaproteobacteria bacterium]|nr:DUF4345 domain-containing protein [Deltaproteobacteria bacterium]
MTLPRAVLILSGTVVLAIGVAFLLAPAAMMQSVDIAVATPLARGDVRAIYGGMEVAVGLLLLLASQRADRVRPGLFAAAVLFTGMVSGRLLGVLLDGAPPPFGWFLAGIELSGAVVCFAMARRA